MNRNDMDSLELKSDVDFIYEYSKLNRLRTRVKILTGEYTGTIFEYWSAVTLHTDEDFTKFNMEYELFEIPVWLSKEENFVEKPELKETLCQFAIATMISRTQDPEEKKKLRDAVMNRISEIKIPVEEDNP